jgi:hypothetical protein
MFIWKKQSKNKTTKNGKNEEDEKKTKNEPNHQTTSIGIYIYRLITNRYRNRKRKMEKAVRMIEVVL